MPHQRAGAQVLPPWSERSARRGLLPRPCREEALASCLFPFPAVLKHPKLPEAALYWPRKEILEDLHFHYGRTGVLKLTVAESVATDQESFADGPASLILSAPSLTKGTQVNSVASRRSPPTLPASSLEPGSGWPDANFGCWTQAWAWKASHQVSQSPACCHAPVELSIPPALCQTAGPTANVLVVRGVTIAEAKPWTQRVA